MSDPKVPRIIALLAVAGLVIASNRWTPGILQAVLGLIVLYVVLANADRFLALVGQVPAELARGFRPRSTGGGVRRALQ